MTGPSSPSLLFCRWNYCPQSFNDARSLSRHLRTHVDALEPQVIHGKRRKLNEGVWEVVSDEEKLEDTFPLRQPGDTTTTTEGTTLSHPQPPSIASQPPPLPTSASAIPNDGRFQEHQPGGSQASQASQASRMAISEGMSGTQRSAMNDDEIFGSFPHHSQNSSIGPSQQSGSNPHSRAGAGSATRQSPSGRLNDSAEFSPPHGFSSPFIAPTQPMATPSTQAKAAGPSSQREMQPPSASSSGQDAASQRRQASQRSSQQSPEQRSATDTSTNSMAAHSQSLDSQGYPMPPSLPDSYQTTHSQDPSLSSHSQSEQSGTRPSDATNNAASFASSAGQQGLGLGRPSNRSTSSSSNPNSSSIHARSDSSSKSTLQFGVAPSPRRVSQDSDGARKVSSGSEAPSVGFAWGAGR